MTDENAPVTFLAPEHPVLTTPNKITAADFEGWVQERGLYFPDQWDEHFTPSSRPATPARRRSKGGLLVAQHGNGYFVYTGLVFFRQLPEGVPGRVSALRQPGLARQMTPDAARPDEPAEAEPPDVARVPHLARGLPVRVRVVRARGGACWPCSRGIFA